MHSIVDSKSLDTIHLDIVGIMYRLEDLKYGQLYYSMTLYDYFWVPITVITNDALTLYLIQQSLRWVKIFSFYSQNCYIKAQIDEASCPVLFILWAARNSLKPVAEIKREFVLLMSGFCTGTGGTESSQIWWEGGEEQEVTAILLMG